LRPLNTPHFPKQNCLLLCTALWSVNLLYTRPKNKTFLQISLKIFHCEPLKSTIGYSPVRALGKWRPA
jgi:hypothetical protein